MRNVNNLDAELGYPSKTITHATGKAIGIQITSTFKPCEDCTLGKAEKRGVRLFFDKALPQLPPLEVRSTGYSSWKMVAIMHGVSF